MTIMKKLLATLLTISLCIVILPNNINAEDGDSFGSATTLGINILHMVGKGDERHREVIDYRYENHQVVLKEGTEIDGLEVSYETDLDGFTGFVIDVKKDVTITSYLGDDNPVLNHIDKNVSIISCLESNNLLIKGNHTLNLVIIARPQEAVAFQEGQSNSSFSFISSTGNVYIGDRNSTLKVNFKTDVDDYDSNPYRYVCGIDAQRIALHNTVLNSKAKNYVFISKYKEPAELNAVQIDGPLLYIDNSTVIDKFKPMYQFEDDVEHGFFQGAFDDTIGEVRINNSVINMKYDSESITKGAAFLLKGESNLTLYKSKIDYYSTSPVTFAQADNIRIINCDEVDIINDYRIISESSEEEHILHKNQSIGLINTNGLAIWDSNFDFETYDMLLCPNRIRGQERISRLESNSLELLSENYPWGDSELFVYIEENKDSYTGIMKVKNAQDNLYGIFPYVEQSLDPVHPEPFLNSLSESSISSIYEYIAVAIKGNNRLKTRRNGVSLKPEMKTNPGGNYFPEGMHVFEYSNTDPYSLIDWDYLEIKKPSSDNTDTRHEVLNTGIN